MKLASSFELPLQASAELVESFRGKPTAIVSDCLERLPGAVGLRPFHRGKYLVGSAFTVKVRPGDNAMIHQALEFIRPGEVLVVDGGGQVERALIGEIIKEIALSRGVAGFVVDGAIRDLSSFTRDDFPCFARDVIHKGPYKTGPGELCVPVTIGGMVVRPGDMVLGDEDGVVAFPQSIAADLLPAVIAQEKRESEIISSIRAGQYQGVYAK